MIVWEALQIAEERLEPKGKGEVHADTHVILPFTIQFSSVQSFSHVRLFATPWTADIRPPCPSSTPGVYSNSCPLSRWCHPTILSSAVSFSSHLQSFPASIRVFLDESVLHIRWPKYWSFSFSISPSNEYSGLISFRIDWFDLLVVQGTQESSPTSQFKSITSSAFSFLCSPTLTSTHDYWKKHSFDYNNLYQQSSVSSF